MKQYIDGFVFPVPRDHLETYREVAEKVAEIWLEHGALEYAEFVADKLSLEGTRSFVDAINADQDETIIFGWVVFDSSQAWELTHQRVAEDPRMGDIVRPLTESPTPIFDAQRMAYAGFRPLVQSSK